MTRCENSIVTDPGQTLELIRIILQQEINAKIQTILNTYIESHIQPAVTNMKHNLGEENVPLRVVEEVCISILENAKEVYQSRSQESPKKLNRSKSPGQVRMSQHELINLERHNYHDFSGAEELHLLGELELPDLQEELRDQVWAGAPQHRPHPGQQVGPPRAAGGAQVGGRQAGEGHTLHPGLQGKQGHLITCQHLFHSKYLRLLALARPGAASTSSTRSCSNTRATRLTRSGSPRPISWRQRAGR